MSDSDDDAAFASADEGDEVTTSTNKSSTAVTEPVKKDETSQKNAQKTASNKSGNKKTTSASANEGEKSVIKTESRKPEDEVVKAASASTSQGKNSKNKKGKKKKEKFIKDNKKMDEVKTEEKTNLTEQTDKSAGQIEDDTGKMAEAASAVISEEPADIQTNECTDKIQDTKKETDITQNESAASDISQGSGGQKTPTSDNSSDDHKSVKSPEDKTSQTREGVTSDTSNVSSGDTEHTPKLALDRLTTDTKPKSSGWGWSSWGSTLMDVASTSVSTFGNQLGDGFSTIIDTVESTLGAPSPEELAHDKPVYKAPEEGEQIDREIDEGKQEEPEEKEATKTEQKTTDGGDENATGGDGGGGGGGGWFSSWGVSSLTSVVQNTTSMVQNTSKSLVTGSLDVLETIGKKTFEVIQEQDPGLQKTKGVLFDKGNKTNLSQLLREAKEEAEVKVEMEKHQEEARMANFGAMFDEYQGLAHLEALEILSNQCEKTVQSLLVSLPEESLKAIKTELIMIKQVFEKDEDDSEDEELEHDFSKLVTEYLSELHLGTTPDKLNRTQEKIRQSIVNFYDADQEEENEKMDVKSMNQTAIQSLAVLTAKAVEQFHKAGELIVLQKDTNKTFLERAKCLSSLTDCLCTEVRIISTKFCHCLNKISDDDDVDDAEKKEVKSAITNIYLEASNSSTYIFDAFQLLLPCLQQAAIQTSSVLSS